MGGVNGELEKGGVNRQWVMGMTMAKRVKTATCCNETVEAKKTNEEQAEAQRGRVCSGCFPNNTFFILGLAICREPSPPPSTLQGASITSLPSHVNLALVS